MREESFLATYITQESGRCTFWELPVSWLLRIQVWESWPYHLSPVQWCGQERNNLSPLHESPPEAGTRPGPGVMRAGELILPLTCNSTQGPTPCMGSTVDLALDMGVAGELALRV